MYMHAFHEQHTQLFVVFEAALYYQRGSMGTGKSSPCEIKSHRCAGSAEELTIRYDLQGNGNTQIGVALGRAAAMIAPVPRIFDKFPVFLLITEIESLGYNITQVPRMQLRVAFRIKLYTLASHR
jgi:hypothetical protein